MPQNHDKNVQRLLFEMMRNLSQTQKLPQLNTHILG